MRTFGDHQVNATFAYTRDYRESDGFRIYAYDFENPVMEFNDLAQGARNNTSNYEKWMQSNVGYLGRIHYTFKNRYMVTGTVRRDGASTFPPESKWAILPSISLGWVLSDEAFMSGTSSWLYSKIRLSYGVNGNPGQARYASFSRMDVGSNYKWATSEGIVVAASPSVTGMGNDKLKWEKTASLNLGIDFNLFKRIDGVIEMYHANTSDVTVQRRLPYMSGFTQIRTNLGELQNRGIEISVNTQNLTKTAIKWRSSASFSLIRNKILDIYSDGTPRDVDNGWFIGESIGAVYDYERKGIWQEEDLWEGRIGRAADNPTVLNNWYPGMWQLVDQNGDKAIDADEDRKIIGNREANFIWTLGNTFNYKQWGLYILFNSSVGGGKRNWLLQDCYNQLNVQSREDDVRRMNQQGNRPYWTYLNRVNNSSAVYHVQPIYGGIYESRAFVRLQDVNLSYSFNRNQLSKMGGFIEQLQLYVSGRNLYTWTKWPGWDPQVQFRNYNNNSSDNVNSFNMRNVIVGLRLTF